MSPEYFWPIFGVLFVLALVALGMIGSHLSASRKMQLRVIQKEERMKAIEAGVPLPEVEEPNGGGPSFAESEEQFQRRVRWLRLVSQVVGFFMLFAGIGMVLGFELVDDEGLREIAALGLLPALAGVGLLLFYFVSRNRTP